MNRASPPLDAVLSAMLLTMLGFGALLFMAAFFIAGYAIGLHIVAPIVGALA